jgi:hypothetical protein
MKFNRLPLLAFLCLLFCSETLFAQNTFQKTIGGDGEDIASWVTEIPNGFIVAGLSTTLNSDQNACLLQLDNAGNLIWQKNYGTSTIFSVVLDEGDGYIALGASVGLPNVDILLVRTDLAGNTLWSKSIGDSSTTDLGLSLVQVPNGYLVSGAQAPTGSLNFNSFLTRLDSNGNTLWSQTYNSGTLGNLFLSNFVENDIIYASGTAEGAGVFLRLDLATGDILSSSAYDGNNDTEALTFQQPTQDSNLVISDQTRSGLLGNQMNPWVQKISKTNGQTIWSKIYSKPGVNLRGRIEQANNGFLLMPFSDSTSVTNDGMLAKIDPDGNVLWSYQYGGNLEERFIKAIQTSDGGFLAVGQSRSNSINGDNDIFVVKTDSNGLVTNCCIRAAGIQAFNYSPQDTLLDYDIFNSHSADSIAINALNISLINESFCTSIPPIDTQSITLCPNETFTLDSIAYNAPGVVRDTIPGIGGGCDTILVYNLLAAPFVSDSQSIQFCIGDSVNIGGQFYTQSGTVVDTLPSMAGCDTLVTYTLEAVVQFDQSATIEFCPGDSVTIAGQVYYQSAIVPDTIQGAGASCDTILTYTLVLLPQPTQNETIEFCQGDSVTIAGQVYTQSGTVVDTISGFGGGCDTVLTYTLVLLQQPTIFETIAFCNGDSVTIAGQVYTQSATVVDTISAIGSGCDTIVTYNLVLTIQPTINEIRTFCNGDSITIGGQVYTQPGTVTDTILSSSGLCDTIATYTLILASQPTISETIQFCQGDTITIGGQIYTQPATVTDTILSSSGLCDTIVTYTLVLLTQPTISETIQFCPGDTISIGGQIYTQAATVTDTILSSSGFCDTIATYVLELLAQPTQSSTIQFCPGDSITIAGQTYTQSGTVVETIPALGGGCDTIVTYTLVLLPQPLRSETIGLCAGDTVIINGVGYSQPGNVLDTIPAIGGGCDTIVSYVLISLTPAPSTVDITCPNDVTVITLPGTGPTAVNYNLPTVTSDCPCPGAALTLTAGLASGSVFPVISTPVCYTATDSCGNTASCCFSVTIREEQPCDEKVAGCMKYEILRITKNAAQQHTYTIRVTNNCSNKMIWSAIRIPNGLVAEEPANNSVFTTPDGRNYDVRNPNFSPFYSVRFKSTADSISGGQSDIFKYTLPAQAGNVNYIYIASRLTNNLTYEAHMNTFNCPVTNQRPAVERIIENNNELSTLYIFPNPTSGMLYADFSAWQDERLQVRIINSQGQLAQNLAIKASGAQQQIVLREGLADGLYFIEILTESGDRQRVRFVLQH